MTRLEGRARAALEPDPSGGAMVSRAASVRALNASLNGRGRPRC